MKKTMQNKLLATFALCASAALAVGFTALPETTASAATTEDVVVATAALRTPDETYGKGLRFRLTMSESFYTANGQAQYTTGVLIAPTGANEELTLTNTSEVLAKAETAAWAYVEADGVYETYVHLYNIEKADYTTKVDVCAYVDYADASTDDLYSAVVTCSVADIADYAYDNDTTLTQDAKDSLKDEYLTYTLTCDKGDGSVATTADVVYGEKLDLEEPTRANYTFDGWYNEAGTEKWNMDSNTVKGNVRLFAKWTVKEKVTLIDAATESALFSNTYVASTDGSKNVMGWGADKGTTYATEANDTYGSVIATANATAYIYGWANFNTGITEDLKTYWTNKLDGMDKVVFYAYNGTSLPHAIRIASADGGLFTDYVTLTANGWTMITIEKSAFLNCFANIAITGNPYIIYHFKGADGGNNGGPGNVTFKFSSFYGYTNAGYEKDFLKKATVLDADVDMAKFAAGAMSGDSQFQATAPALAGGVSVATDATYGNVVKIDITNHGWAAVAPFNFNAGVTDIYAYWSEKLAGMDKVVFYFYNGYTADINIALATNAAGIICTQQSIAANSWGMYTIDVSAFLSHLSSNSYVYISIVNSGNPNVNGYTFMFSDFVGYSNLAYEKEFGA